MKKVLVCFMTLVLAFSIVPLTLAESKTRTSGDYEYTVKGNGTATIVRYLGAKNTDIIIPMMIDGYMITTIGREAFARDNVTIPPANRSIDTISVTLPASITSIEDLAFHKLGLFSINIPDSVVNIGYGAFSYCGREIEFRISTKHPKYAVIDGSLYDKSAKELLYYHQWSDIPEGITSIGAYSCYGIYREDFRLPSTIEKIGKSAFEYAEIGDLRINVEKIEERAFANARMRAVFIEAQVIGNEAFEKARMDSLEIRYGLQEIGDSAFYSAQVFEEPKATSTDKIYHKVSLPSSVHKLGNSCFCGFQGSLDLSACDLIVEIPSSAFQAITEDRFGINGTNINVTFPLNSAIETIGKYAFYRSTVLNLSLPATCKTIYSNAFGTVKDFYLPESLIYIDTDAFAIDSTFVVEAGSYAERWASENAYPYSIYGEEQNLDWLN